MGSRRVPTWAWPFRGAPHAGVEARLSLRAQGALLRAIVLEQDQDGAIAALRRGRRMDSQHVGALAQHPDDPVLQYRDATVRLQALAVAHAPAAPPRDGTGQ